MSRPNRCIKDENGEDLWISRSSVVIPIVFKIDQQGNIYTLLEERGQTVSHPHEWACPCGYIDWDENLEDACQREVYEETSLLLNQSNIKFFDVTTNKYSRNQSIDHWYECWVDSDSEINMNKIITKDEVLDLRWLKVAKLEKGLFRKYLTIYRRNIIEGCGKWAFKTHKLFINKMLRKHFNNCRILESDEIFYSV